MKSLGIILKTTLKQIILALPIILLMFIMLPGVFGLFMGGMLDAEKQEKIEPVMVEIVDEDKTALSKNVGNVIFDESLDDFFVKNTEDEGEIVITIPKGYEKAIQSKKSINIDLEAESNAKYKEFLKNILDNYHTTLYVSGDEEKAKKLAALNAGSIVEFDDLQSDDAVVSSGAHMIDADVTTAGLVVGFIGMVFAMFLANSSQARSLETAKGAEFRQKAMPISKGKLLFYNVCSEGMYILLVALGYIGIFNVICGAFSGNILLVIGAALVASIFTAVASAFISEFIPPKFALPITMIVMLLTTLGGFTAIGIFDVIPNPFDFIVTMFEAVGEPKVFFEQAIKILGVAGVLVVGIIMKHKRSTLKRVRG